MIEVGEYIRTRKGITKIKKTSKECSLCENGLIVNNETYKHSKNIIDLIELGDYVNGMRVIATENRGRYNEEKQKDEKVILTENYDEWTENGVISNEDIKTILTHEQYEQNCYKVVE